MLAFLSGGCATQAELYGLKMNSVVGATDLTATRDAKGYVQWKTKYANSVDSTIEAWGDISSVSVRIRITNNSSNPIKTNYFLDNFSLSLKNGKNYILDKRNILNYPKNDYINPGETVEYNLGLPQVIWEIKKEQIDWITCNIGGSSTILLVPISSIKTKS